MEHFTQTRKALDKLGIAGLNEMQLAAQDTVFNNESTVLLAPTGSGKTLAFLLPALQRLSAGEHVQVLIVVPSRELALQIEQVFRKMSTGFKVNCCYGGHSTRIERNNFQHPAAVVVGTPGRLAYHLRHENFDPATVHTLILDEFDKSLEFGFEDDMAFIIEKLANLQKRILTSATSIPQLPAFTGIEKAATVNFLKDSETLPQLSLAAIKCDARDKLDALFALICYAGNQSVLVFCNHRDAVERVGEMLYSRGLLHGVFHGGMDQEDRERALLKFRNGSHRMLITTDLASRGLDIPEIGVIIHYQIPPTHDAFIHRNGRTARMQATGKAFLIISSDEYEPKYLTEPLTYIEVPRVEQLPSPTKWATLYIGAGKKDKVNKVDIVGLLLQKGGLQKDELGLIEIYDKAAYAAVTRNKIEKTLTLLRNEKIKGKKVRMGMEL